MSQDATEVRRTEPSTHIVNSTHVHNKTKVCIPLTELVALLRQRGLMVAPGYRLEAVLDGDTLCVSWSVEDLNRQTANVIPFPLVNQPDPDLTAPEEPGPSPLVDISPAEASGPAEQVI